MSKSEVGWEGTPSVGSVVPHRASKGEVATGAGYDSFGDIDVIPEIYIGRHSLPREDELVKSLIRPCFFRDFSLNDSGDTT